MRRACCLQISWSPARPTLGGAPIFPLISGLVIERGGMLSHGAIVAREFGIPAVVDARQATTRIAHGSQLSLDGDTGHVQWTEATP